MMPGHNGFSRADSLLLCRVLTHSDIPGFYRRRFDLFAITPITSQPLSVFATSL
jgi:hypothetical protein